MSIQVIFRDEEVQHLLERLDVALSPAALAEFFLGAEVGPYLLGRIENRFEQEGDDVSGAWAPLKDATQSIRAALGFQPAHPINVRTGELLQFLMHGWQAAPEAFGASLTVPDNDPTGELEEKMMMAQAGGPRAVPRPVLGMNLTDLAVVLMELDRYLTKMTGGTRL